MLQLLSYLIFTDFPLAPVLFSILKKKNMNVFCYEMHNI